MTPNQGKKIERIFVKATNGKEFRYLPKGLKDNLRHMFKSIKDDDIIYSGLIDGCQKPDLYLQVNGVRRNISLKSGTAKDVGGYGLKNFISYLRSKGISERTLKIIVLMHFADGTINNTGKIRYTADQFRRGREHLLAEANKEMNKNKEFIKEIVKKVVFEGFYDGNISADYIYFGDHYHGYCCNYRQVCRQIDKKKWAYITNIHIGPLMPRPSARYISMQAEDDSRRWGVKFTWPDLEGEIKSIGASFRYQYDGYIPLAERKEDKEGGGSGH